MCVGSCYFMVAADVGSAGKLSIKLYECNFRVVCISFFFFMEVCKLVAGKCWAIISVGS